MGFGKDGKGVIMREFTGLDPGALAAGAVIKSTAGVQLETTSFRIIKTEFQVVQRSLFQANNDWLIFGICDNELSTTEIAETIQLDGPADRNQTQEAATAERPVWLLAEIRDQEIAGNSSMVQLNNGMPMEKTLRWTFTPTEGWAWFFYNPLSGAITTGAQFLIIAKHYGVWVD